MDRVPQPELPVACSLDAAALARRQNDLRAGVLAQAIAVEALPNGYRWRFAHAPDLFARLGAIIDAERQCCRFLYFILTADAGKGAVTMEVTGPAGTSEFLEGWVRPVT
jgi:hypothetical protein